MSLKWRYSILRMENGGMEKVGSWVPERALHKCIKPLFTVDDPNVKGQTIRVPLKGSAAMILFSNALNPLLDCSNIKGQTIRVPERVLQPWPFFQMH